MREAVKNVIEVWGHRGESIRYPENTIPSFTAAMEAGAQGIELDIQKTADGFFVVIHDDTLDRTTDGSGKVSDLSLDEIRSLDAGAGAGVPELAEVLEALSSYKGCLVDVELKEETIEPSDYRAIREILETYSENLRYLVTSFRHELLKAYSLDGYQTGLLIGEQHEKAGIRGIASSIRKNRPTHLNLPCEIYNRLPPRTVRFGLRLLLLSGKKLVFWTVNEAADFHRVRRVATAVISDNPAMMLSLAAGS